MECSDFRKLISKELDGEIREGDRDVLGAHLDSCESCREFRGSLLEMSALHREMTAVEAPSTMLPAIIAATEEREAEETRKWWVGIPVTAAAVLAVLIGIGIGGFLTEVFTPAAVNGQADVLELEYLDEYPPESVGEVLLSAAEGGGDEQR